MHLNASVIRTQEFRFVRFRNTRLRNTSEAQQALTARCSHWLLLWVSTHHAESILHDCTRHTTCEIIDIPFAMHSFLFLVLLLRLLHLTFFPFELVIRLYFIFLFFLVDLCNRHSPFKHSLLADFRDLCAGFLIPIVDLNKHEIFREMIEAHFKDTLSNGNMYNTPCAHRANHCESPIILKPNQDEMSREWTTTQTVFLQREMLDKILLNLSVLAWRNSQRKLNRIWITDALNGEPAILADTPIRFL